MSSHLNHLSSIVILFLLMPAFLAQPFVPNSSISRIQSIEINSRTHSPSTFISYSEIKTYLNHFNNSNLIEDFSEIAIDTLNKFVYISAKNHLLKLSFNNASLTLINKTTDLLKWEPYIDVINDCRSSSSVDNFEKYCQNYVRLVIVDSDRLFLCGTYAGRPTCTWRNKNNLHQTLDTFDGIGKCPNSPESSLVYLRANNGDHYFATSIDYSDQGMRADYLIDRSLGPSNQIRTDQFNSNWLNDPVFVATFEIGEYIYFFMRETAIEAMNCGQRVYSRVARLCKHEQGSQNYNVWRSFEKARLNCSVPGDVNKKSRNEQFSFYFDEIQSVSYQEKEGLIYAVFTTPLNGVKGSAVCVYDIASLELAFDGPFNYQKAQDSIWEPYILSKKQSKCSADIYQSYSKEPSKFQLKHSSIQPLHNQPIIITEHYRLNKLAIDTIRTKHNQLTNMLFLSTDQNTILKYMLLDNNKNNKKAPIACLIEEVEIADRSLPPSSINNLVLLTEPTDHNLLIATKKGLIHMPVSNCQAQTNYFSCLSLMSPYCVWNSRSQTCLFIYKTGSQSGAVFEDSHLHQHLINECPKNDLPVDGGFGQWSEWKECAMSSGEKCECRMRVCDSPRPKNGGKMCDETKSIEILNCQVNGGWTPWSTWSSCRLPNTEEPSCDLTSSPSQIYIRTRTRSCTNPQPKNNGRICIGLDQEEQICSPEMINPCTRLITSSNWKHWGAWEACSKPCGGGFQMRKRQCNSKICLGCNQEWRTCNTQPCMTTNKQVQSDWLKVDQVKNQKLEQTSKFECRFDPNLEGIGLDVIDVNITTEYRICSLELGDDCRSVSSLEEIDQFGDWSEWSGCSDRCNEHEWRTRECLKEEANACFGVLKEERECKCKRERLNGFEMFLGEGIIVMPEKFEIIHLIIACSLTFMMGSAVVLFIIFICFKSKSASLCCCSSNKPAKTSHSFSPKDHHDPHNSLSDQTSLETDTATTTDELTKNLQYNCMTSSNSSSVSHSHTSNHKEYFTVGNRFDQGNLTSLLLNATVQDDEAEDELNTFQMTNNLSGTLGRNGNKLPNKSFNTYATHAPNGKGMSLMNTRLVANAANINASNRLSGSGTSGNQAGSVRGVSKQPRNSFAFTMRTNLDQEV